MIVSFNQLANVGLVKDVNSELLPTQPFAWTEAQNIRFKDGSASKIGGSEIIISTPVAPYFLTRVPTPDGSLYIIGGANKCYSLYGNGWYNITRQVSGADYDYNASYDSNWQSCVLNTFPILNNGNDAPQQWKPLNPSEPLIPLTGWPTNTTTKIIRSFKAYLIAGNIIGSAGETYPSRLMWSGAALPGGLPTSWDATDLTQDAGYFDLADTPGPIIDMKVLGDNLIVYKDKATYILQYIGGNNIFAIKTQFFNTGVIAANCVAEVKGGHLVLTADDIISTDGNSYKSIIDGRLRTYLFTTINPNATNKCFVVPNYKYNEVWFCIPTGTNTTPNIAYIFNYETSVWTTRTLPSTPYICSDVLDLATSSSFDSYSSTTFDSASFAYNNSVYNRASQSLMMVDTTNSRLVLLDSNLNTELGTNMYTVLERKNITLDDDENIKTIKRIWPKMTLISGTTSSVNFYIGSQMKRNESITWNGPYAFDITSGDKIDCFVTGRWLSIKIESNTDIRWSIENFELDTVSGGKW